MDIKIAYYETEMKPQVALLFENEYQIPKNDFQDLMTRLYEHPLQKEKSIQLVALDGDMVVGFQSFFYWPYVLNGNTLYSLQSGNSITHPNYRGKGIFKKLLNFVFENKNVLQADFMMGFPVQASYGSFIKNNWTNVLNLEWYVKPLNPLAFLFNNKNIEKHFQSNFKIHSESISTLLTLSTQSDFYNWKQNLKENKSNYFFYTYRISAHQSITFEMKIQTRKKIIKEVIIGKIYFEGNVIDYLPEALKECVKKLRKTKCVAICSIAINEHLQNPNYVSILNSLSFNKINKHIYFIVRPLNNTASVFEPNLWHIGRADIDTW